MSHPVIRQKPSARKTRIILSLDAALDLFLLDRKVKRATPNTLEFYSRQLKPFISWCRGQGVTCLEEVAPAHVRAFVVALQDRNLSDHSVHAAARALRAWLNFAVSEELIIVSPMTKVGMPKVEQRIRPAFKPDDVTRLREACDTHRDRAIVLFLLDSGCRASEFVGLNGGDVDAATGIVRIRLGKGRKERIAFLGSEALRALLRYYRWRGGAPGSQQPVWVNLAGEARLTDSGLRQMLERLGLRAGVAECHPHTFRRTFALMCLRNGMSIYHLQRLMGHADIAILRQYLALTEDDLQAAHARFGVVDNLGRK